MKVAIRLNEEQAAKLEPLVSQQRPGRSANVFFVIGSAFDPLSGETILQAHFARLDWQDAKRACKLIVKLSQEISKP